MRHRQIGFWGLANPCFQSAENQQCERLQISISITRPRTPGIFSRAIQDNVLRDV